jgi:hypothetical protein
VIHVDIGSWADRPRIREENYMLRHREDGRISMFVSEGTVTLTVEDGQGEDNPLCEVRITKEMLTVALAALDATEEENYGEATMHHGGEVDHGRAHAHRDDEAGDCCCCRSSDWRADKDRRSHRRSGGNAR